MHAGLGFVLKVNIRAIASELVGVSIASSSVSLFFCVRGQLLPDSGVVTHDRRLQ